MQQNDQESTNSEKHVNVTTPAEKQAKSGKRLKKVHRKSGKAITVIKHWPKKVGGCMVNIQKSESCATLLLKKKNDTEKSNCYAFTSQL